MSAPKSTPKSTPKSATIRVAIWLVPGDEDHDALTQRIGDLAARHGGPMFEPHMTLHVGPVAADCDVEAAMAAFAAETPPVVLEAGPTGHSETFYRALYLSLATDRRDGPRLASMQRRIAEALRDATPARLTKPSVLDTGGADAQALEAALAAYPLHPHLSLLYGTFDTDLRERLARQENLVGQSLRLDTIAAVRPADGHVDLSSVAHWHIFGRRRLGN